MRAFTTAEAQFAPTDIEQARAACLHYTHTAPLPDTKFRETADPGWQPRDLFDLGYLAGPEHIQRHQHDGLAIRTRNLLRFSLR